MSGSIATGRRLATTAVSLLMRRRLPLLLVLFASEPWWPMQPSVLLTSSGNPSHRSAGGKEGGRGRALDISLSNVDGRGGPSPISVMFWYSTAAPQFQYHQYTENRCTDIVS